MNKYSRHGSSSCLPGEAGNLLGLIGSELRKIREPLIYNTQMVFQDPEQRSQEYVASGVFGLKFSFEKNVLEHSQVIPAYHKGNKRNSLSESFEFKLRQPQYGVIINSMVSGVILDGFEPQIYLCANMGMSFTISWFFHLLKWGLE